MIVLAIDPGKTTGFAAWDTERGEMRLWESTDDRHDVVGAVIAASEVVYEMFHYYRQAKHVDTNACEVIGLIKWYGRGKPLKAQLAVNAKKAYPNDRLKEVGWYRRGKPHAMDAVRHLLYYMDQKNLIVAGREKIQ